MKRFGFGILLLAVAVAGCGKREKPETKEDAAPPVTITVGDVRHDHQIALGVAALQADRMKAEFGIYLKEVKAREVYDLIEGDQPLARLMIKKVSGASAMPAAMERGEIQIGLGGITPVAKFIDNGQPIKIILPLHTDGDMLVMKKDSPIENWKDFVAAARKAKKPIRIGYKGPSAVAKLVFVGALKFEKIAFSDKGMAEGAKVLLINASGGKNMIPLLEKGEVDGIVMNQPIPAKVETKGLGKIVAELQNLPPAGKWTAHPCCIVVATETMLTKNRPVMLAFVKLLMGATKIINEDKVAAAELASKWTKQPQAVEDRSVPGIPYVARFTDSYARGLITWAEMMQDIGFFKKRLADKTPAQVVAEVVDPSLAAEAAEALSEKAPLK